MSYTYKNQIPPLYAPPPSYAQCTGTSVPPASPFTSADPCGPTIITTIVPLGDGSTHTICPYCCSEIDTQATTTPGLRAYISGLIIALLGCWAGCCLIPFCMDDCMDVHHTCPHCKAYLGKHRK